MRHFCYHILLKNGIEPSNSAAKFCFYAQGIGCQDIATGIFIPVGKVIIGRHYCAGKRYYSHLYADFISA